MSVAVFWKTLVEGIIAFVATHIDDFLLLALLFAQVQIQPSWKPWYVWLGGYIGLIGLIGISLLGYFGGLLLPPPVIGLLGLIPVAVGCWKLWRPGNEEEAIEKELEELQEHPPQKTGFASLPFISPPVLMSVTLTFANGGDNISLYVPLFASSTPPQLLLFFVIFMLMKGLWFAIAQKLSLHPVIVKVLTEQGEHWVPWILIGLGIWILVENETWRWFVSYLVNGILG
ncbi:MAG: cadmium resistance transporter [Cyanobacteriota bacterium]